MPRAEAFRKLETIPIFQRALRVTIPNGRIFAYKSYRTKRGYREWKQMNQ
jgi:hypothetical protein